MSIRDVSIENSEQKTTVTKFYFLDTIKLLRNIFQEYKQDKRGKERGIKKLKERNSTMSKKLNDLDSVIYKQEQYSRNKGNQG